MEIARKGIANKARPTSGVNYKVLGAEKHAQTAIQALVDILRTVSSGDEEFFVKLSSEVRGKTRSYVSRRREFVYPGNDKLVASTVEIAPGWWLGTNLANRDKLKIIERACRIKGLVLGRDVAVNFPNVQKNGLP